MHARRMFLSGVLAATLMGCGVAPVTQDQPPELKPGEGIAAIVIDSLDPLSQIFIVPDNSKGKQLTITSTPPGRTLFLFVAQAGTYCFDQIHFGDYFFTRNGRGQCFDVTADHISYSGDLTPRVENGEVQFNLNNNARAFRQMLQKQFPGIAAKFPIDTPGR